MSRIYVHSKRYTRHSRLLVSLAVLLVLLVLGLAGSKAYSQYVKLNQSPDTQIGTPSAPMLGYITPYFMFKDTGKWTEDKADSSAHHIIYQQYQAGTAVRQLEVYVNKTPTVTELAASRVLPVKVTGGDSLAPGSLSDSCSGSLPAGQQAVTKVKVSGIDMYCDPGAGSYSVILAQTGGSYELKMLGSKVPETFVVIYHDYSSQPEPDTIVNIANTFRAV